MKEQPSVKEKYLWDIWLSRKFTAPLSTVNGDVVEVLDPGIHNKDKSGPDFENAKVKIGGITYLGDIEIDVNYSDWKNHNHHLDKRYNKIALHISFFNNNQTPFVYSCFDRKIPTLCLKDFLPSDIIDRIIAESNSSEELIELKCSNYNSSIPSAEKLEYLGELGLKRLNKKVLRIFERLKELIYFNQLKIAEPVYKYEPGELYFDKRFDILLFDDSEIWRQVLYEFIFEALGYSQNKGIMLSLAKAVPLRFLEKNLNTDKSPVYVVESILYNISGLLADKNDDYISLLKDTWDGLQTKYDGETFEDADWNFFRLRPNNFPTLRIAAGVRVILKIINENFLNSVLEGFKLEMSSEERKLYLKNILIIAADVYWENHYVFEKEIKAKNKYLLGDLRAAEIILNVFVPYAVLYARIFNLKEVYKNAVKFYIESQIIEKNKVVEAMLKGLNMEGIKLKGIETQGIIELKKTRCDNEKCSGCNIGRNAANFAPSFS